MRNFFSIISSLIFIVCAVPISAFSLVEIDINKGVMKPIPVAILELKGEGKESGKFAKNIATVINNDLLNSGMFRMIDHEAFIEKPKLNELPQFGNWRKINATVLLLGNVSMGGLNDRVRAEFKVWDPYKEQLLSSAVLEIDKRSWRRIGHRMANAVYEATIGEPGHFDTRIMFVAESGKIKNRIKRLAIMDQDGANFHILTNGRDMVTTPCFDHNSHRAIYTSYKNRVPQVFIIDIATGALRSIGKFPGMSFSPRFSPDGEHIITSMARNGTTGIYEVNLFTGERRKVINDIGTISTSPSYSPDGEYIAFNSNRGGSRQIYIMNKSTKRIKRISFGEGSYATPIWSPRGDFIAFTKYLKNEFYIGVMRIDGTGERLLSRSWSEESPTWSPNGRIIMFHRHYKDDSVRLHTVDISGRHIRMVHAPEFASNPTWSSTLN